MDQIIKGTLKIPVCNPRLLLTITWFSFILMTDQKYVRMYTTFIRILYLSRYVTVRAKTNLVHTSKFATSMLCNFC